VHDPDIGTLAGLNGGGELLVHVGPLDRVGDDLDVVVLGVNSSTICSMNGPSPPVNPFQ
jgi:hypothetical protein